MSFTAICPAINEQLLNLSGEHTPQTKRSQLGFLRALTDQYNTYGVDIVPLNQNNGQIKTVQVMSQKRSTTNEVTEAIDTCLTSPFDESDNFAQDVTIGYEIQQKFSYTERDIRELCEGRGSWIAKDIAGRLDAMGQVINARMITIAAANFGNYSGGVNSGVSPIALDLISLVATGGQQSANYIGASTMKNTLSDARTKGKPMVIGVGDLRNYSNIVGIGCCNTGGIQVERGADDFFYFEDSQVATVLGNNDMFIALEANALQFIPVPFYKGEYETMQEDFTRSTIVDPELGFEYDFKIILDKECDTWNASLTLHYGVASLYNNAYRTGDPLFDVNGIFKFNAAT